MSFKKNFIDLIHRIQSDIKAGNNINSFLDTAIEEALSFFKATTGSISVADPDKKVLTIITARGMDKEKRLAAVFPYNVGITGVAAASREVVYAPNVHKDKRYVKLIDSVMSELAVPMLSKDELIGVLNLESDTENFFTEDQIWLAQIYANQLSLLLVENRFYNRLIALESKEPLDRILGYDPQIIFIKSRIRTIAPSDASVFIYGESGTGKELIAKSIHELSTRKTKPFISLNCGALNENLLESELFGHVKGAFTGADKSTIGRFEAADGGSLFLDEIGEMPPALQVKLLRVLQEGEIEKVGSTKKQQLNVRIISATHRNLPVEVQKGNFRLDLYYRLSVIPLHLPPLRERKGDIPVLAHNFLMKFNSYYHKNKSLSIEAIECLTEHNWEGNVRELENAIQYSAILSQEDTIYPENLPDTIKTKNTPPTNATNKIVEQKVEINNSKQEFDWNLERAILKLEADYIQKAYSEVKGQQKVADLLGISRGALQYKIKKNPFLINFNRDD